MKEKDIAKGMEWTGPAVRDFFKSRCPAFAKLSQDTLEDMLSAGRALTFASGKEVATRDEGRKGIAVILQGTLRTYSISPDGREYRISVQEAGEVNGVLSTLDGGSSPHDAVAGSDLSLFFISAAECRRLMSQHPDFNEAIIQILCYRLRQSFTMLDQFAIGSPRLRLAKCLLDLAASHGRNVPQGTLIDFEMTQDSLGAMIGLSRQRTNTHLKAFERDGAIRQESGRLIVVDRDELQRVLEQE